jgi:phospholipid/cholesterol/gamma-HCH transport system permease protein
VPERDQRTAPPTDAERGVTTGEEAPDPFLRRLGRSVILLLLRPFAEVGTFGRMIAEAAVWGVRPPYRWRQLIAAMEFIGVGSIFIVGLTGVFLGMVLGLQLADGFRQFQAENQTGGVVGIALTREMAPVFAALMVSSRAGSAMATEIGSMRVSNQIDALVTMAVNPVQYLVVPRLLAGMIMVPLLATLFTVTGMFGAYLVCIHILNLDPGMFIDRVRWFVDWPDMMQGLIKATVFGFTVCLIACRQGFYASGGAEGVGRATTRAVVQSAVAIVALDYVLTSVIMGQTFF